MGKWSQGKFSLKNPDKYKGTLPIIYRSSWEARVFHFLDMHPAIIEWASETIQIPYFYKLDGQTHRYFVDVNFIVNDKNGQQLRYLVEIKPAEQTVPPKAPKTMNQKAINRYNHAMATYQKNVDKWMAAEAWAKNHGYIFAVWTEKELGISSV